MAVISFMIQAPGDNAIKVLFITETVAKSGRLLVTNNFSS